MPRSTRNTRRLSWRIRQRRGFNRTTPRSLATHGLPMRSDRRPSAVIRVWSAAVTIPYADAFARTGSAGTPIQGMG
jgi:hypothetical protein